MKFHIKEIKQYTELIICEKPSIFDFGPMFVPLYQNPIDVEKFNFDHRALSIARQRTESFSLEEYPFSRRIARDLDLELKMIVTKEEWVELKVIEKPVGYFNGVSTFIIDEEEYDFTLSYNSDKNQTEIELNKTIQTPLDEKNDERIEECYNEYRKDIIYYTNKMESRKRMEESFQEIDIKEDKKKILEWSERTAFIVLTTLFFIIGVALLLNAGSLQLIPIIINILFSSSFSFILVWVLGDR